MSLLEPDLDKAELLCRDFDAGYGDSSPSFVVSAVSFGRISM